MKPLKFNCRLFLLATLLYSFYVLSTVITASDDTFVSQIPSSSPIMTTTTRRPSISQQMSSRRPNRTNGKSSRNKSRENLHNHSSSSRADKSAARDEQNSGVDSNKENQRSDQYSSRAQLYPFALAQQQARLMSWYNNTPPYFLTETRDFFVDVMRYPLGTKLTTIKAIDMNRDPLEYSLKPANIRDASPYFSIDSATGELRLANKHMPFSADHSILSQSRSTSLDDSMDSEPVVIGKIEESDKLGEEKGEEEEENAGKSSTTTSRNPNEEAQEHKSNNDNNDDEYESVMSRNLYFLNVAACDGRYTSILELQIHVINSSSIAASLPVQLTPEGSRRSIADSLEMVNRQKTTEFYDRLLNFPSSSFTNGSKTNPIVVYPNFVNPSLVRPEAQITNHKPSAHHSSPIDDLDSASSSTGRSSSVVMRSFQEEPARLTAQIDSQQPLLKNNLQVNTTSVNAMQADKRQQLDSPFASPDSRMFAISVVLCAFLMIALATSVVVVSVKRIKRRLKNVERQHENLSHRTSNGSSMACSSSGLSSLSGLNANNDPSLSHFTIGGSSVCRQSSLDSTVTKLTSPAFQPFEGQINRVNNGSIANPVYLQHQHQQHQLTHQYLNNHHSQQGRTTLMTQQQNFHIHQQQQHQQIQNVGIWETPGLLQPTQPMQDQNSRHQQLEQQDNVYYPIEDDMYSTINNNEIISNIGTFSQQATVLNRSSATGNRNHDIKGEYESINNRDRNLHNYMMALCSQLREPTTTETSDGRDLESPTSDSGSSTRSLARFLSLPLKYHTSCQMTTQQAGVDDHNLDLDNEQAIKKGESASKKVSSVIQKHHQVASKTIARGSRIDRERNCQQPNNEWELDRNRLKFVDILDEGQFGQVWRCKLKMVGGGEERTVATKTLKKSALKDAREREELLAEIEVMKIVCNHPNVVEILHCCTSDATISLSTKVLPILLVMEYVELGKLQSFLEKYRENHHYATNLYNNIHATSDHLTSRDLVKFIYHIAKGMEYISSQCIVHRDLAARNILVSSQRICKIGDFGMARHMQSVGSIYERRSRNTKVPVRWMAPEVLLHNKFTTKSDIFSFGILMWEIVTLGSTPYRHLKTEQVIESVARNGERPAKPEYCHSQLYWIMSKCWLHEPDERPTFRNLVKQLDELLLSSNDYIELDQYPDHNYYNTSLSTLVPNNIEILD